MQNLFSVTAKTTIPRKFGKGEIASIVYHNIFDFPLTDFDMLKWCAGKNVKINLQQARVFKRGGYYFLEGKEGIIYKRTLTKRISERKMEKAKKASMILATIPFVKMVAVTGSLAMENSGESSDIDLMVITETKKLWTTRLVSYFLMRIFGFNLRKPGDNNQKDKLCLNIWMDEHDLTWKNNRNLYTAHEIAQIIPLVNKNKAYERFLFANKWILNFWPNAVKIGKSKIDGKWKMEDGNSRGIVERIAYGLQLNYMIKRITREVVTPTRALFHPQDWGKIVLGRLTT